MAKIPVAQEQAAIYVQKDGYTLTQPSEKSDDMRTGTQGYANVGFRVVRTDF